jgi:replicative DNA helicase
LKAIIVDYIQLMDDPPGDKRPRHQIVGEYSRSLKKMAKEMGVPVVALAQLNREVAGRTSGRPLLSDLRESGNLEQDADVVLLLHRDVDEDPTVLHVGIPKNRQGMQDAKQLTWDAAHARLLDKRWTPGGM